VPCRFGRRVNVHATCHPFSFRFFFLSLSLSVFLLILLILLLISILQLCHDVKNNRREHLVYFIPSWML
jgi:hypothetical protein